MERNHALYHCPVNWLHPISGYLLLTILSLVSVSVIPGQIVPAEIRADDTPRLDDRNFAAIRADTMVTGLNYVRTCYTNGVVASENWAVTRKWEDSFGDRYGIIKKKQSGQPMTLPVGLVRQYSIKSELMWETDIPYSPFDIQTEVFYDGIEKTIVQFCPAEQDPGVLLMINRPWKKLHHYQRTDYRYDIPVSKGYMERNRRVGEWMELDGKGQAQYIIYENGVAITRSREKD